MRSTLFNNALRFDGTGGAYLKRTNTATDHSPTITVSCKTNHRQLRDHSTKPAAIKHSLMAAATTSASADQQVCCCLQPLNSSFLITILPRGEPGNKTAVKVRSSAETLSME